MPTPNTNEDRIDFINRCMGDSESVTDFPDTNQRYAFCVSQWNNQDKKIMDIKELDFAKKKAMLNKTIINK